MILILTIFPHLAKLESEDWCSGRSSLATEHPLLVNELLGDTTEAIDAITQGLLPHHIEFPEKLKWMVFKVKKRAKRDYFKAIGQRDVEETPFYTFNWPYDNFSLVELAQVQSDVTIGSTILKQEPASIPVVPAETIESKRLNPDADVRTPSGQVPNTPASGQTLDTDPNEVGRTGNNAQLNTDGVELT